MKTKEATGEVVLYRIYFIIEKALQNAEIRKDSGRANAYKDTLCFLRTNRKEILDPDALTWPGSLNKKR